MAQKTELDPQCFLIKHQNKRLNKRPWLLRANPASTHLFKLLTALPRSWILINDEAWSCACKKCAENHLNTAWTYFAKLFFSSRAQLQLPSWVESKQMRAPVMWEEWECARTSVHLWTVLTELMRRFISFNHSLFK